MTPRFRLLWLLLFGLAMGYFEASVVVYLRELYYPQGFSFPLVEAPARIILVELGRELASLLMILAVAWLAGKGGWERFAHFCLLFGTWDIVYYLALKLTLGWPGALTDWDVLFLIPVPWLGQVWQPVLVSISLLTGAAVIHVLQAKGHAIRIPAWLWALEVAAGLLVILSFTWDWRLIVEGGGPPASPRLVLFWTGLALGMAGLGWGARETLLQRRGERA